MHRPTFAIVDTHAFAHNVNIIRSRLSPETRLMIAVKANAYGHGIEPIMSRIRQLAVDAVAVASVEEALQIRQLDVTTPILILGALAPEDLVIAAEHNLQVLYTDTWGNIDDIPSLPCPLQVHIAIDTGMNRLGFKSTDALRPILQAIDSRPDMVWSGVCTHLAAADAPTVDHAQAQIDRLRCALDAIRSWGYVIPPVHAASSGGVFRNSDWHFDMVRVGIAAYGYSPDGDVVPIPELRPVMHLYSSITRVATIQAGETVGYGATFRAERPMRIATVGIGYGDGFPRILSNCGVLRVRGQNARVVGRVCMDQVMIDVSGIQGVQVGDFVTVFGVDPPQAWHLDSWRKTPADERAAWLKETFAAVADGEVGLSLATVAKYAQTIPYEILCQINQRVAKLYVGH
ncbi:alanine racemase [Alicyclobacillus acidiphilus]|uniref:alanine racemase n=1 Tax=Alicyclobacillus acidiphilus TaxID=182455 RepID=UPI000834DBF1|nr:alanine racemase [Alicyclobacillus acidiphilus]